MQELHPDQIAQRLHQLTGLSVALGNAPETGTLLECILHAANTLKNEPEFAGAHHERMDGKGYPRGLTGERMSLPARLMAIADIFEALTARDRPCKTGKTLSESLQILGRFAVNGPGYTP